jgi:hypothetical protein
MAAPKSPKTSLNLRKAQGEVVVEFDGRFYRITKFDAA